MSDMKLQNTKIIATIGPSSSSYEDMKALVEAGVDVFRLNFSHANHAFYKEMIQQILEIRKETNVHVGILADLQGPKLRVGEIENNRLELKAGDVLTFVNTPCMGTMEQIYMSYKNFARDVKVGEHVLVDDGKLEFEVMESNGVDEVQLKALYGGILSSNKGVNLPNTKISLPSLTEKDLKDLDFILTQRAVNWIALSFVRSGKGMKDLKARIDAKGHGAKTIAKIEKPEAIENIKKIIKYSNAIMIARGDLGIEVPMEKLPGLQKMIIASCIQRARPVIVATQMMDSMITNPTPTRAEITDVANAVMDGTDAVMLSGETAVGAHPIRVVKAMIRILEEAEQYMNLAGKAPKVNAKSTTFLSDAVCLSAAALAEELNAKGIIGLTKSGYTAFKVSSYRPKTNIFIFSDEHDILATLNLVWGVRCFYYDRFTTTDGTICDTVEILKNNGLVENGEIVINTGSMPIDKKLRTNFVKATIVD